MKIKHEAYVINLDEYCITFYMLGNDFFYFDSFGVEHVSKGIRCFIGKKNMETNIFRIQADIFASDFWTICLQAKL